MADNKPRVAPQLTGVSAAVKMPEPPSRGGGMPSPYPFGDLDVGKAFGVKNKDKKAMSSVVSNQNRKFREPILNDAGEPTYETKDASDGQGGTVQVPDTSKPKTQQTKHFTAFDVDADLKKQIKGTDLEGSTCLVFRDK